MPVRQRIDLASALPLLLFSGSLLAQSEPTPTTAAGPVEVPETTEVQGTVSEDLVGRWLVVGDIKLPDGKVRPVTRAWEIRHGSEQLELVLARAGSRRSQPKGRQGGERGQTLDARTRRPPTGRRKLGHGQAPDGSARLE